MLLGVFVGSDYVETALGYCPVCGAGVAFARIFRSRGLLRRKVRYTVLIRHPDAGGWRLCYVVFVDGSSVDPDERRLFEILEEVFAMSRADVRSVKGVADLGAVFDRLNSVFEELRGMVAVVAEKQLRKGVNRAGA